MAQISLGKKKIFLCSGHTSLTCQAIQQVFKLQTTSI